MENNTNCSVNECPVKSCLGKLICGALPVFLWLVAAGYVIHHIWLMPEYQATAPLWRPVDEMKDMMPWMFARYGVLALVISGLFCKVKKGQQACMEASGATPADCQIGGKHCPIKKGICFGIMIGILMGAMNMGAYIKMPIPSDMAVKWFIGDLIEGIGAGIVLSLICYLKKKNCGK